MLWCSHMGNHVIDMHVVTMTLDAYRKRQH